MLDIRQRPGLDPTDTLTDAGITMYAEHPLEGGTTMAESVYKVIELVGTSTESWEKAAEAAVKKAGESLRELRIAEVVELDMQIEGGKVKAYRSKVRVSFKYES